MLPLYITMGNIDPAEELKHYSINRLKPDVMALKRGKTIDLEPDKRDLCAMLDRFIDGTYTYRETEHFNPEVALRLKKRTRQVMTNGVTADQLNGLLDTYVRTADEYLIDTNRADETAEALAISRKQFLQEKNKG